MSFEEFLQKKNEEAKAKPVIDREERIRLFREYVDSFYHQLKNDWLQKFYDTMHPTFTSVTLHEEALGDYTMKSLNLSVGSSIVKFIPIGTILIGTQGRIDMLCDGKKAMFIMTGEKARSPQAHIMISEGGKRQPKRNYGPLVWKLVDERGMMSFVDLNAETIQRLIMDMAK